MPAKQKNPTVPIALLAALATITLFNPEDLPGEEPAQSPVTLHVSKLGDNSDGLTWQTAFHSIQKALDAIPDDRGNHKIIVRPDTYVEANLAPAHKGAAGAYNTLIGDFDGSLGSGAKGWVVIDAGDPEKGFKSWDWWGSIRASDKHWPHGNNQETFSSIVWDRWTLRNLYTAGGDAGFFWDLTNKSGEGFTVVVENCVGTGPCLRWRGRLPDRPPRRTEHLPTLLLPRLRLGRRYGRHPRRWLGEDHARPSPCRLRRLHPRPFRQRRRRFLRQPLRPGEVHQLPHDRPQLHPARDGRKVNGYPLHPGPFPDRPAPHRPGRLHPRRLQPLHPGPDADALTYTTKGKVQAYVQFKQPVPEGFKRLGQWPVELFSQMAPPESPAE